MTRHEEMNQRRHWRSLDELAEEPGFVAELQSEFPAGADEFVSSGIDRRRFLGIMGASVALAGVGTGCIRKPVEKIAPYSNRPEDLIPGNAVFFATSAFVGGDVSPMLVESHDGRPTQIHANTAHPDGFGSSTFAQASVLGLYDQDRLRASTRDGVTVSTSELMASLNELGAKGGIGVLVDATPSPTRASLINALEAAGNSVYVSDAGQQVNSAAGLAIAGLAGHNTLYDLGNARVIVAVDSDFLSSGPANMRNARGFGKLRHVDSPDDEMNRLYVIEPAFTSTGSTADNRLCIKASAIGNFLATVAQKLFGGGLSVPSGGRALVDAATKHASAEFDTWAAAVAKDLTKNAGACVVAVGERQPPHVHALAHLINVALGNVGQTVSFVKAHTLPKKGLSNFVADINSGKVKTAVVMTPDPVYNSPGDVDVAAALSKAQTSVYFGLHADATAAACNMVFATNHFLEDWGDLQSHSGATSIQQPLIAPLHDTASALEGLGRLAGKDSSAHELVKSYWSTQGKAVANTAAEDEVAESEGGPFSGEAQATLATATESSNVKWDKDWATWLADGFTSHQSERTLPRWNWSKATALWSAPANSADPTSFELLFPLDSKLYDGRYANNGWLQEAPDPITKLTWDNGVLISPATARANDITNGDILKVSVGDASLEIAAWITPGVANQVLVLNRGYGLELGRIAKGAGVDVGPLRTAANPNFVDGGSFAKTGGRYELASTQDHWALDTGFEHVDGEGYHGRNIIRDATLSYYKENPTFVTDTEVMPADRLKPLWEPTAARDGQQWGMHIDLNSCIGCNACLVACQAENNIPIVGKEQVMNGREMHWMRLDRYFVGDEENPEVAVQPMACAQCEMAPCENVCPVQATSHSPDGLNDMAYNRCIGTRYCSNNCPYKVRRFNFFNYNLDKDPLVAMQRNPNVSVRFRGVMEKCTYCVQRIRHASSEAKKEGREILKDGEVLVACESTCPTGCITFGNINDPESRVAKRKKNDLNFGVLSELDLHPRTTYGAKLRNPNPELV